ncbi:hypothetical protein OWV82_015967 [Melia azedarach]|nr:hypothetical protein OWV82_015967 [Melia azedarach]
MRRVYGIPQQTLWPDSAGYMLMYIEYMCRGQRLMFSVDDVARFRKKIALDLFRRGKRQELLKFLRPVGEGCMH